MIKKETKIKKERKIKKKNNSQEGDKNQGDKNPAYGRHQLSWPMRIVGPIQERKGKKCPFLHTVTLGLQNIIKEKLHIHQKCISKQFEIFHQQMHISFKNK